MELMSGQRPDRRYAGGVRGSYTGIYGSAHIRQGNFDTQIRRERRREIPQAKLSLSQNA